MSSNLGSCALRMTKPRSAPVAPHEGTHLVAKSDETVAPSEHHIEMIQLATDFAKNRAGRGILAHGLVLVTSADRCAAVMAIDVSFSRARQGA